jgi:hypothetical protein
MRVSGPFEILSKRSLLRHTGHSRQHALRVMMVMAMMEVQPVHLHFRVAFEVVEVNPRVFSESSNLQTCSLTCLDSSRTLPQ